MSAVTAAASTRILLVEGAPGVGKSTLVNRLERRYAAEASLRSRSFLRLGQAHTHWPAMGYAGEPGVAPLGLMERTCSMLEEMAAAVRGEGEPYFWCLIDTLYLTLSQRPGGLAEAEVAGCERRLSALGCGLVFLTAEPRTVRERCVNGRAGNPWLEAMEARHGGPEAVVAAIMAEQARMAAVIEALPTPALVLRAESPEAELEAAAWELWSRRRGR